MSSLACRHASVVGAERCSRPVHVASENQAGNGAYREGYPGVSDTPPSPAQIRPYRAETATNTGYERAVVLNACNDRGDCRATALLASDDVGEVRFAETSAKTAASEFTWRFPTPIHDRGCVRCSEYSDGPHRSAWLRSSDPVGLLYSATCFGRTSAASEPVLTSSTNAAA